MDPSISESVHVVGFFSPRGNDKELPMLQFRRPGSATLQAVGESAAPTKNKEELEEHYALADFTAEDASQVSFKRGDKVFVKTKDESGWWLCKLENGQMGWAPPTFLKKKEAASYEDPDLERSVDSEGYITVQPSFKRTVLPVVENAAAANFVSVPVENGSPDHDTEEVTAQEYIAIESYQADGPGQVSFEEGEKVHVLEKLEDGWWFVSIGNQEGWAPCSYLERLNWEDEEEEELVTTLDKIEKYYAVDDYEAEEDDEISFPEGAVVDVMQKRLNGWWLIRYEDQIGLAPGTFLRKKAYTDLPIISEDQESEFPVSDSKRKEAMAYENVQLQMMRAQPPRRKSMRQWVRNKNNYSSIKAPAVLPRQNSPPKKQAAGYNQQPHHRADLSLKEETGATRSKTLTVPQQQEAWQCQGSIRQVLQGKGGVRNRVQTFERDEGDLFQGQLPIMMKKPDMPRARTRKQKLAQTGRGGEEGGNRAGAASQQAQPRIKPRTKIQKTSSNGPAASSDDPPPPPLPPKSSRRSPPHIASPTRQLPPDVTSPVKRSPSPHVTSPMRKSANEKLASNPSHHDIPPPVGPGHPSHDRSHDQPPPLGPGHPDDVELPLTPPRPRPSVIERARRERSPKLAVPSTSEDLASVRTYGSSPSTMSSRSYPRSKPKHQKVKKSRSQTTADQRFQAAHPSQDHQSVTRLGSAKITSRENVHSGGEAPPPNGEVGEASGGGGISFNEEFTTMLIKHILDSNNPSLKAKLKNLIENNDDTRNSLTDILQ